MPSRSLHLLRRQADGTAPDAGASAVCQADEIDNEWAQLRIASIFIILVGSLLGALFPIWLSRSRASGSGVFKLAFFISKYFGAGVIVSTAFMHLISPANEILGKDCLKGLLHGYDWSMAIVLMTVMTMFLVELLASWFEDKKLAADGNGSSNAPYDAGKKRDVEAASLDDGAHSTAPAGSGRSVTEEPKEGLFVPEVPEVPAPGGAGDHLGHGRKHVEGDSHLAYAGKMTSIVILEAGILLHSVFIGLTLAVASQFLVLFVVLVFHQTFEGLGLGSRLATFDWPADRRRWTPWIFGVVYGLTTPVAIAAGLGVKEALARDPTTRFMVQGICNAVSGGILLYTGVVELLAHEFMFNPAMDRASMQYKLMAFSCMSLGAGLMALLAKWA
ncbi:zinc-regulated transporter 2 [Gaeumannomyces tritici R3-111a-1]|uniref:Zinc-regulated transporter 2 n=1 Tax=Gaeumannomyces tritici (strain R3-111a-1) TaxID=644352 RepID=J3NIQ8_GAET3|nr:zinc-regulated transporter 2 [Gaeumannomyces tritici R3-111a-1]EJT81157.1 zinc-regulated transporter 2 [Gaeumannomyces tritici R3-111a-1]